MFVPLVTIYISGPGGQYATNVEAVSSHDAVRKGLEFFLDPFWKGPKPQPGTNWSVPTPTSERR